MTFFNTGAGKDGYFLHFETDDKEKYLYMQEQARKCIDNAYTTEFAPVVHAHWERKEDYVGAYHTCSNCHSRCPSIMTVPSTVYNPYGEEKEIELSGIVHCPYCGAIMDEEIK